MRSAQQALKRQRRGKPKRDHAGLAYARSTIYAVCCLAGSPSFVADYRDDLQSDGVLAAVDSHDTPVLFEWLVKAFSFQGIADAIASGYLDRHGSVTWADITADLASKPACRKLRSYWQFHDCDYRKGAATCNEPDLWSRCPLPKHPLRNGRLNQTAYSLFLFIRDIAGGDLIGWIDQQLATTDVHRGPDQLTSMAESLVGPLRHVYGVSDKVLMMTLSSLLLGSDKPVWTDVGASMIAVDTLVHNFLHRTGILHRLDSVHPYGRACYKPNCCADIIRRVSGQLDARQFNPAFPSDFPRFVQNAIWRYCAQSHADMCNGNRIDDHRQQRCQNGHCRLYWSCDRKPLFERHSTRQLAN